MNKVEITNHILYVGVDDREIDLFEGQYMVPEGVSYNSYLIMDEKIALMDTVDVRKSEEWLANIKVILGARQRRCWSRRCQGAGSPRSRIRQRP